MLDVMLFFSTELYACVCHLGHIIYVRSVRVNKLIGMRREDDVRRTSI